MQKQTHTLTKPKLVNLGTHELVNLTTPFPINLKNPKDRGSDNYLNWIALTGCTVLTKSVGTISERKQTTTVPPQTAAICHQIILTGAEET